MLGLYLEEDPQVKSIIVLCSSVFIMCISVSLMRILFLGLPNLLGHWLSYEKTLADNKLRVVT